MSPIRHLKILFSAPAVLFLLMVGLTDVSEYPTNPAFVRKVALLQGLFTGEEFLWISKKGAWMHDLPCILMLQWGMPCGSLAIFGAWRMCRARRSCRPSLPMAWRSTFRSAARRGRRRVVPRAEGRCFLRRRECSAPHGGVPADAGLACWNSDRVLAGTTIARFFLAVLLFPDLADRFSL